MPVEFTIQPIYPKPRDYPNNVLVKLDAELKQVLQGAVKNTLKREFAKRVRGWSKPPQFVGRFAYQRAARGDDPTMTVYPRATGRAGLSERDKYAYVSKGTPGRMIRVKRAKRLSYRHYNPHTRAGNFYGGPGTYYGPVKHAQQVWNPGIEARHFEENIIRDTDRDIRTQIQNAVNRALK